MLHHQRHEIRRFPLQSKGDAFVSLGVRAFIADLGRGVHFARHFNRTPDEKRALAPFCGFEK